MWGTNFAIVFFFFFNISLSLSRFILFRTILERSYFGTKWRNEGTCVFSFEIVAFFYNEGGALRKSVVEL